MNWYKIYKMAMPLPVDYDGPYNGGVNRIDRDMNQETADAEKAKYPEGKYIGHGTFGLVSDIGNGQVIKYITKYTDAKKAESLIGKDKEYPIVKVLSVEKIQTYKEENYDNDIWAIRMEKVVPLDGKYHGIFSWLKDYIGHPQFYNYIEVGNDKYDIRKLSLSERIRVLTLAANFKNERVGYDKITEDECKFFFDEMPNLFRLKEIDLFWDCSIYNVGINQDGHLVLLDLGSN